MSAESAAKKWAEAHDADDFENEIIRDICHPKVEVCDAYGDNPKWFTIWAENRPVYHADEVS